MTVDAIEGSGARRGAAHIDTRGSRHGHREGEGMPGVSAAHGAPGVVSQDLIETIEKVVDARLESILGAGPISADWIICQVGPSCPVCRDEQS